MAKPNTYVQLLNAQREIAQLRANVDLMKGFTLQQALDMAEIALNLEFSFGPKYIERFEQKFFEVFLEYAQMCVDDGEDDPSIEYTKEKVDRALRVARGEILPFELRYAEENLYFRNRDLKKPEAGKDAE